MRVREVFDVTCLEQARGHRATACSQRRHPVGVSSGGRRSFNAVDWVVSFAEDTPENLLRQVKPDVLVKGGDYGIDQVVGADIVRAYGGEVRVLGLVENSSTTAIVEKIRSK